jgi:hypothetical protein
MIVHLGDWASVVGFGVGIAGLIYSALAFMEAKSGKKSADEARRAVRRLVAADRFHTLRSRASDLFSNVEFDNVSVAAFLARDLRFEIDTAVTRWDFLDVETKSRFRQASQAAVQISDFIMSRGQLDPKAKSKVLRKCSMILSVLGAESGKIQGSLESGGES